MYLKRLAVFVQRRVNHVPEIKRAEYKPKTFQVGVHDLGRITTIKNTKEYKAYGEQLHREFQLEAQRVSMRRFAALIVFLFGVSFLERENKENVDFEKYWDLKNDVNVYADLTAGGMEFGDQ